MVSQIRSGTNSSLGKLQVTNLDICIEEVSFEQSRQRHNDSRILQAAHFGFDLLADQFIELFWQNDLDLHSTQRLLCGPTSTKDYCVVEMLFRYCGEWLLLDWWLVRINIARENSIRNIGFRHWSLRLEKAKHGDGSTYC